MMQSVQVWRIAGICTSDLVVACDSIFQSEASKNAAENNPITSANTKSTHTCYGVLFYYIK